MVSEDWTLGEFGDERLTKRGVCFSRGWSLGRASAFGDWPVPERGFHILTRASLDRSIAGGGKLSTAPLQPAGTASIEVRARPGRPARTAKLETRFGRVALKRPKNLAKYKELAETVEVSLVEVREVDAPPGAEPIRRWPGG